MSNQPLEQLDMILSGEHEPNGKKPRKVYDQKYKNSNREKIRTYQRVANWRKMGILYMQEDDTLVPIEWSHFISLLEEQEYRCAICQRLIDTSATLDHDHETSIARGVLCKQCNTGLGGFQDTIPVIFRAIEYLQEYSLVTRLPLSEESNEDIDRPG